MYPPARIPSKQKLMDLGLTNVVEDFLRLKILKQDYCQSRHVIPLTLKWEEQ